MTILIIKLIGKRGGLRKDVQGEVWEEIVEP